MGIKKRAAVSGLALLLIFSALFISCRKTVTYQDEIIAMAKFLVFFDDEDILQIDVFKKYTVSDRDTYYFLEWVYPTDDDHNSYQSLLVYNKQARVAEFKPMANLDAGLSVHIKEEWDKVKDLPPDISFNAEEIAEIKHEAIIMKIKTKEKQNAFNTQ